jgi:predicted Zn-dependent peptidase
MFGVYAGVAPDKAIECIEVILKELKTFKSTPVDASELRGAKEFIKGNLLLASDSVDNQMVRLAQNEIHFKRYVPLDEILEYVESITVDDIIELAQTLFQEDQLVLTLLGPVDEKRSYQDILSL